MSNLMVERVEAMVGREAERVERVVGLERVVGIGMAAMVEGRVGVIVLSLLVSLNNLVCTVQVSGGNVRLKNVSQATLDFVYPQSCVSHGDASTYS